MACFACCSFDSRGIGPNECQKWNDYGKDESLVNLYYSWSLRLFLWKKMKKNIARALCESIYGMWCESNGKDQISQQTFWRTSSQNGQEIFEKNSLCICVHIEHITFMPAKIWLYYVITDNWRLHKQEFGGRTEAEITQRLKTTMEEQLTCCFKLVLPTTQKRSIVGLHNESAVICYGFKVERRKTKRKTARSSSRGLYCYGSLQF